MLLNVGPRPDGRIDPAQADRVREMGQWLSRNGESIYATRGGPWLPGKYGVSTHHDNLVYIHLLQSAHDSTLALPSLPVRVKRATLLHGGDVPFQQTAATITFDLTGVPADAIDTILKLELAEPWSSSAVVPVTTP
jgi:alpha-L-fucosidase